MNPQKPSSEFRCNFCAHSLGGCSGIGAGGGGGESIGSGGCFFMYLKYAYKHMILLCIAIRRGIEFPPVGSPVPSPFKPDLVQFSKHMPTSHDSELP